MIEAYLGVFASKCFNYTMLTGQWKDIYQGLPFDIFLSGIWTIPYKTFSECLRCQRDKIVEKTILIIKLNMYK